MEHASAVKMSIKKKELLSTVMKRTSEWIYSLEIPSDVTVIVGEASYSLNKFALLSKCGYIKKLISGPEKTVEISDLPGGSEGFDYAAKFCNGVDFEMNPENIGLLRCAAEFLEMTEDNAVGNLVSKTELYLTEVALKSLSGAISILHSCETLLPMAEKVKLVSRCIDTIALLTCRDSIFAAPSKDDLLSSSNSRPIIDYWWAEDLTVLRIDLFQRVLIAMMARGFKQPALGPILMLYAKKSLRGLDIYAKVRKKMEAREEHEKRVILETIVSLLPREKNTLSVSFLSMLLRAAIYLDVAASSRLELERRMAGQLGQAVLDDLLIPSYSISSNTLFDIGTVQRIMTNFLESEAAEANGGDDGHVSPTAADIERVTKLMESYLAEIASDRNLSVAQFTAMSELVPEHARPTEDGMYRAVDIFLKAHPGVTDTERKKVCSVMDCQKLSREACAHAAQNERLPVQTVVQVLYYEQQRLRDAVDGGSSGQSTESPAASSPHSPYPGGARPANSEVASLRKENQELKIELVKMKTRLNEMEKTSDKLPVSVNYSPAIASPAAAPAVGKPPLPKKSFISTVSQKIGRFLRTDGLRDPAPKGKTRPGKDRRHSIS